MRHKTEVENRNKRKMISGFWINLAFKFRKTINQITINRIANNQITN